MLTLVFSLCLSLFTSCQQSQSNETYLNLADSVAYVGIETCRTCHYDKWETFSHTGMGQSFDRATPLKSASKIHRDSVLFDVHSDFYYHPFWKSDSLMLREYRLSNGDTVHNRTQAIDYIVGSGQHTNSHLINSNGYLHQAPFTYYTQKEQFDLPPGFEDGFNTRFDRKIGLECMSCHNSLPEMVLGSENKYTEVHMGISCERCHGPGEIHAREKVQGKFVDTSKYTDYTIVNPAKISDELQFDLCSRCHLQGNAVLQEGKSFYDFKPGMQLEEVMDVYLPKYSNDDEFIMASHVDRLKMSECFVKSEGDLTCVSCHNPHLSVKYTSNDVFNKACISCHQEEIQHSQPNTTDCITCHMPHSGSKDIPHVSVTDHNIAIPVSQTNNVDTVEKKFLGLFCVNNDKPSDLSKLRAYLQQYEKFELEEYYLDSALFYLKRIDASLILSEWVQYYFFKSDYQAIIKWVESQPLNLLDTHLSEMSYDNKHAWTWYRIAESYYKVNDWKTSVKYYKKAGLLAPYHLDIQNKYAMALIRNGNLDAARERFEFIISENPIFEKVYPSYGYLLSQMGESEKAVLQYQKAISLNPDLLYAWLNYGAHYLQQGDINNLEKCLKEVLRIDPKHVQAKQLINQIHEENNH